MKSKITPSIILCIFMTAFVILVYAQDIYEQGGPSPGYNDTKLYERGYPKLESVLYELTQATDYKKFAQEHDLDVIDNKVRVYLELNNKFVLPSEFGTEEIKLDQYNLIQALVYVDKLLNLTENPNIKFIRVPGKGITQDSSNIQKAQIKTIEDTQLPQKANIGFFRKIWNWFKNLFS